MRVCHVCSGHSEDDGRVFHRECLTLAEAGYEVHLIARSARHEAYSNRSVAIHPLPDPKSRQERLARRLVRGADGGIPLPGPVPRPRA